MDFDDILQNFEKQARRPQRTGETERIQDLEALTQAWIQERLSPELLPYKTDLIDRILERIRKQVEYIELNSIELQNQKEIKLLLVITESELDRVTYLVRGYTRARLSKVDQFPLYIRIREEEVKKLSANEFAYMERHLEILSELYNSQFLGKMPESLQAIDDTSGSMSMIEAPDLNRAVFIKSFVDTRVFLDGDEDDIELEKGSVFLLRYSLVQDLVKSGDVVLI